MFKKNYTNLISLYNTNPTSTNISSTPDFVHATIRICLPFRLFKTVLNKLHEQPQTGIKITYNTFFQYYYILFLKNGIPFSSMTLLNVNVINTSIKKFKLLLHTCFQNILRPLITAFLGTLKNLSILRHTPNPIYMS